MRPIDEANDRDRFWARAASARRRLAGSSSAAVLRTASYLVAQLLVAAVAIAGVGAAPAGSRESRCRELAPGKHRFDYIGFEVWDCRACRSAVRSR